MQNTFLNVVLYFCGRVEPTGHQQKPMNNIFQKTSFIVAFAVLAKKNGKFGPTYF